MELPALYDFARKQNIEVLPFPLKQNGSMSLMSDSGQCFVGMDASVMDGDVREKVHLAHELGIVPPAVFTMYMPPSTTASATKTGQTSGRSAAWCRCRRWTMR